MTNPVFKTFYNHRIFVIYQPEDYRQYLLRIVDQEGWPESERFGLKLGLMAWGTILVYQSRMVASDFHRRLKGLVKADGSFLHQNPSLPLSRPFYRQQLAMQLGIEVIARTPDVKERIEETPIVAQYIYDTLYMPSFYHERGRGDTSVEGLTVPFRANREDMCNHLWRRSIGEGEAPEGFIPSATVDFLFTDILQKYFDLLSNPRSIQEKTRQYAAELPAEDRRLWFALAEVLNQRRKLVTYRVKKLKQAPKKRVKKLKQAPKKIAKQDSPPNG
jgi:hypothetical protein